MRGATWAIFIGIPRSASRRPKPGIRCKCRNDLTGQMVATVAHGGDFTVNGMLPWVTLTSCMVRTVQCSMYSPGGKVGARANSTSGDDSSRGCRCSTSRPSRQIDSREWIWSIGRSKRTKNSLLGSPITALALGAESRTETSCALADAENAVTNRPIRTRRRIEISMQDNFANHARSKGRTSHDLDGDVVRHVDGRSIARGAQHHRTFAADLGVL